MCGKQPTKNHARNRLRILAAAVTLALPCFGAGPATIQVVGLSTITIDLTQPVFGQLSVVVKDSNGNGVPNVKVTFSAPSTGASGTFVNSGKSSDTISTNGVGAAMDTLIPNLTPGTYVVFASCLNTTTFQLLTTSWTITNIGPPAHIILQGSTSQSTTIGTPFPKPLALRITDAAGYPIPNVVVTFQCGPANCMQAGTADGFSVIAVPTDTNGVASYAPTANGVVGTYAVIAGTSLMSNNVVFTFNLTNLPVTMPTSLTVAPGSTPQAVPVGTNFAPLGMYLRDASNNPVAGVRIFWQGSSSPGFPAANTLGHNISTNALGYASIGAQANNVPGGPYTLTAQVNAPGVGLPNLSVQFSLTNLGPPASLAPVPASTPQSTTVGTQFPRPLAATVKDSAGNPLSGVSVAFTIQVVPTGSATGTFSNGNSTITVPSDSSGVASVTFTANQVAGSYNVYAVAGSISTTFSLTNTAAVAPTITQQPSSISVIAGSTATFMAAATGSPAPTVKWQGDNKGNGVFADIPGATSTSLSFTASATQNGNQYRAIFSNGTSTATTSAATLTVTSNASIGPTITAILNNSSRIPMAYPNYGIAPSTLFVIQGTGLADPGSPVLQDSAQGLQTTLNGASIAVTVNGKTTQPAIYYTSPTQISAVLPAATPVGTGTIKVTYKGTASAAFPMKVVASALGFTTYNGSALATDAVTGALLTYVQSGKPGEIIILWSTGLGADPADSDTTYTSSPHSIAVNLQMFIGGMKADVIYQGASVYPGVSVIGLTIPANVQAGCYVPVAALIDNVVSNIAPSR